MLQVSYVDEIYYDDMYQQIRFIFYFRRKPLYFITTLIIPCALLSFLSLLVFLLPAEAQEKISLGITILLSFSVFQLLIANGMPETSDYVPLISKQVTLAKNKLLKLSYSYVDHLCRSALKHSPPKIAG